MNVTLRSKSNLSREFKSCIIFVKAKFMKFECVFLIRCWAKCVINALKKIHFSIHFFQFNQYIIKLCQIDMSTTWFELFTRFRLWTSRKNVRENEERHNEIWRRQRWKIEKWIRFDNFIHDCRWRWWDWKNKCNHEIWSKTITSFDWLSSVLW